MKYGRTILTAIGVVALLVSFTSQASAEFLPGTEALRLHINDHSQGQGHPPVDLEPPGIFNNEQRRFRFNNTGNPHIVPNRFSIEWVVDADPDPFLHVTYTITNISPITKDFTLTSTLPITPAITGSSLTGGSVSLTVIDSGGGTAELSSASGGEPIYMSQLDGVDFNPLMVSPQSFTTLAYGTTAGGPESFGTPIPSLVGPAVLSDIGIELNARLTAGDTAVIVATFVVTPEPGTMALLTLGATTMIMRRKRRRA